jgi:ABC-type transport system substrate-binding protein
MRDPRACAPYSTLRTCCIHYFEQKRVRFNERRGHEVQRLNYGFFSDPEEIDIYNRMLRETDFTKVRALMRQYDTRINQQAHQLLVNWWHRIVPMRSYVNGWKISPSHYLNQDWRISGSTSDVGVATVQFY